MTDNDIIKALECCSSTYNCNTCEYHNRHCNGDLNVPLKDALDLINRQKAEIERLKDILYDAEGVNLVNYWHQQCEIAENGNRNFEEENKNLKAEIERLTEENKKVSAYIGNGWGYVSFLEFVKNQRAEAVKEFAEKLIGSATTVLFGGTHDYGLVSTNYINFLLKERVGDAKEVN